jgi:hypothetical protein
MKIYILVPLLLLIYLAFIAYFTYPGDNPELSYTRYSLSIGITVVIIAVLSFFLKKKSDRKKRWKKE